MTSIVSSSILIENKLAKRNINDNNVANTANKGIDFANDTVLVSAKNDVTVAQATEALLAQPKATTEMNLAHIATDYAKQLGDYQNLFNLSTIAANATESLATVQKNVLTQLASSNERVASVSTQQTAAAEKVASFRSTGDAIRASKFSAVNAHEARIATLGSKLSNLNSQLEGLEDTEENAATIASLKKQIEAVKRDIKNEKSALAATKAKFDAQIQTNTQNLLAATTEHESLTEQLAQEVLTQTGLNLQAAMYAAQILEAQTFEQGLMGLLTNVLAGLVKTEDKQTQEEAKLNEQETKYNQAVETTKTKENEYAVKEAELKGQNKENNIFMA